MPTFIESRLEFTFDDNWRVEKWDSQPAYRDARAFGASDGTRACDFIGHHASGGAFLIEVKNFTGDHHGNRDRVPSGEMLNESAGKVRDTLAGAIWARGRQYDTDPLSSLISTTLDGLIRKVPELAVVVWIEGRPQLRAQSALALQTELAWRLSRWFKIRNVVVTNSERFTPSVIPGLTVRPLS
ncbi:MAG: hypothetical protein Q8M65_01930 [Rhodoglobus sp.]|nr:hypothetical protein [Rhodoglobus sp.]